MNSKILIVDDTPDHLQLLFKYLGNRNYKFLFAQSGEKAIKTAKLMNPNLILLDVIMSGLDGFAVCRQLKANSDTKNIPIILMSASSENKDKIEGLKLGAVDYITKPINREELLVRIANHLSLQTLHQRLVKDAAQQKLLWSISERIRQSLNLNTIIETATTEIRSFLGCDVVGLAKLNNQSISIKAYAAVEDIQLDAAKTIPYCDLCPSPEQHQFYLDGNICVFQKEVIETTTLKIATIKPQSRIIAPILIKYTDLANDDNTLWGWLIAEEYNTPRQWQNDEIDLLKKLTTQLAIGIKQGLLHQQLSQVALLDSLTCVYNRRYFDQKLNLEWYRLKRLSAPLSLIMCDVDYFKIYNDTYGHQQGDKCLQQVAKAIASTLKRPADVLARYGGEEFGIILPQTHPEGAITVAESIRVAVKQLNLPHRNSLVDSVVTISVGVSSTVPNAQDDSDLLLGAADLALYQAKAQGRDSIAVYCEPISNSKEPQELKFRWIKRLRKALKFNQFSLYAQPITSLGTDDPKRYFEILLRLTDHQEVILPHIFLSIAESNFLMTDIDTWVINNLFATLASCDRSYWQNYRFSINLSGASLNNETFMNFLSQKLADSNLPGHLFCFEITETVAISNLSQVVEFIRYIKNLGCSFALDDFGKGMSSLTYLKNLPVDYLKIDGSFIKELNNNPTSKIMVEAINYIAEGIGLKTVAEFVENQLILDSVRDLKIDYAQGFHCGQPEALIKAIA